jgi:MFS family permease
MSIEPVPGELEAEAGLLDTHHGPTADRLVTRPFVLLWLCGWFYFLGIGAISPLLPRFVKDSLGEGDTTVGVIVAMMAVSAVVVRPLAGRLTNQRGRRPIATVGAFVAAVSFATYAIPNVETLAAARLVTGVAEALFFTAAATMVTELAPDNRRGEAVSYFSVAVYLGTGFGPAVGEWVSSQWNTRLGFFVAAFFGLVATLISRWLRETRPTGESNAAAPHLRRVNRIALMPGFVLALGMMSNVAFASFMPLYADQIHTGASGVYIAYAVVVILVRLFGARLPDVLGPSRCGTVATLVIAAGMSTISLSGTAWGLYLGSAIMGIGISFLYPSLMKLVVDRAPEEERASAVATFTAFFDVATGFGGLGVGLVASAAGYPAAFSTAAGSALVALGVLQAVVLRPARKAQSQA